MTYEGKVWRVDYKRGEQYASVVVLADTLAAAQEMARQAIPDAEVVAFYAMQGFVGAIHRLTL